MSGISTGKGVLSGSASIPSTDGLAVSPTSHSVTIVAEKKQEGNTIDAHNGIYGSYTTYKVTALKPGTYVIQGSASSCTSYTKTQSSIYWSTYSISAKASGSFTCTVTVVDVTSISIPNTKTMTIGENYTFTPTIYQTGATTTLKWSSSDTSIASISSSGVLTAIGLGTATITCTAHNGVSTQCLVTVNPRLASSISLNASTAELVSGEQLKLTATLLPANTTNKTVTWITSNPSIATVDDNGLVTAISPGQCSITATTADGSNKTASCFINVLSNVLYAENAVGVSSGTLVLPIQLDNSASITGLQFELQLPPGINVGTDKNGNYMATMSDRAFDQSILCSQLSNGNYQVVVFSGTSAAFSGAEGAIAYMTLCIGEDVAEGAYTLSIKEVELTKTNGETIHHKDLSARLTITATIVGDTNGDSKVTVSDAVGIVNHILGRTPSVFISKGADVNGDGDITISDAVNVINMILNK